MTIEKYNPEDHFELLASWWTDRKVPVPEKEFMAPTGFIVNDHSLHPVCAGFLFKTDAKIAIISHVVSNPRKMDGPTRDRCLNFLISHLVRRAHIEGFKMVTASSNLERLNKRYEAHGFQKTDSNEVHYGRAL